MLWWNPFLTTDERASIRRGAELVRQSNPRAYWLTCSLIIFCTTVFVGVLVALLAKGAYASALTLVLFWSTVYIAASWLAARDIRRLHGR